MEIENYKCFSLTNKGEVTPLMQLKARFGRVDLVLKFFREIRPEDLNIYVKELKNKLDDVVGFIKSLKIQLKIFILMCKYFWYLKF